MKQSISLPTRDLRQAILMGGLCALALLIAVFLRVEGGRATLAGCTGPTCPIGATLGESACPGCGLSRSTALAVQGEWAQSATLHPAGGLVVLCCLGGLLIYLDVVRRRRRTRVHDWMIGWGRRVLVAGLILAWVVRGLGWT